MRTSSFKKMRGRGINTPSRNVVVAAARGLIIRGKLGPDNPAAGYFDPDLE
jgi:hypothetical protein